MSIHDRRATLKLIFTLLISTFWGGISPEVVQAYPSPNHLQAYTTQANDELGILFYSVHRDDTGLFDAVNSGYYWVRPDGTDALLLASWEEIVAQAEGLLQVESISPDGRYVLYLTQTSDLEATDIFSLDLLSGSVTQHTATVDGEASWRPVWSPDGTQFAYLSGDPPRQFATSVRLFDTTTNQAQDIFADPDGFIISVEWAADGKSLAVLVSIPTQEQLQAVVISPEGSIQREITLPPEAAPARLVLHDDSLYFVCNTGKHEDVCRCDLETEVFENFLVKAGFMQAIDSFVVMPNGTLLISYTNYIPDGSGIVPPEGRSSTMRVDLAIGEGYEFSRAFHEMRHAIRLTTRLPVIPEVPLSSEDGDWLVFETFRNGAADLYRMRPDGSDVQRLTRTPEVVETYPVWSPNGQQLAFIAHDDPSNSGHLSRHRAFLIGGDGRDTRLVIPEHVQELFSPPAWSPDGTSVLFTVPDYDHPSNRVSIIHVDASRGDVRNLTDDTYKNESPAWSPNGEWIAFSSTRPGVFTVHIMRPDGTDIQAVTDCGSSCPVWSPDSEWIAFSAKCSGTAGLFRAHPDGSDMQQLMTDNLPIIGMFSWSPNGRWLAFYSQDATLYLLEIETGVVQKMPGDFAAAVGPPTWSADSEWLFFTGEVDDQWDIFRVRPDGSNLENLTQHPGTDWMPTWRPNPHTG